MTALGLLAGFIHVFSGPDHLAAIAPLSTRRKLQPWKTGLIWGIGHSLGVVVVGWLLHFARETELVDTVSSSAETLVGITLILIGIWAIRTRNRHGHSKLEKSNVHPTPNPKGRTSAALSIGLLHGLAGASHLFALLPLTIIDNTMEAALYLSAYCGGTILAMTAFAHGFARITHRITRNSEQVQARIVTGSACIALLIGTFWLIH